MHTKALSFRFSLWWTWDQLKSPRTISTAGLTYWKSSKLPVEKVFPQVKLHVEPLVCYCVFMHINMWTLVIRSCPPSLHFKLNRVWWLTSKSWSRVSCHAALRALCSSPGQAAQFSLISLLITFGFKYVFPKLKVPVPFSFIHRHRWIRYFCSQSTNFGYYRILHCLWCVMWESPAFIQSPATYTISYKMPPGISLMGSLICILCLLPILAML